MKQRFADFILQQHLFPTEEKVLLAVSGGRDSVAMTHLAHSIGLRFSIAHCNFNLRPADCDRDRDFVQSLASRFSVQFHEASFSTRLYASSHGQSIEEAARELRYAFFQKLCLENGYTCVLTAHHRDDSIETFFLNLFRGTGIAGLHGIRPLSSMHFPTGDLIVARPMLCFSRAEIDAYMQQNALDFVEDYTNYETDALRNKLRLQLMPYLRGIYPSIDSTMTSNMDRLFEVEQVYKDRVEELRGRLLRERPADSLPGVPAYYEIFFFDLLHLSPRRTLVHELLHPFGFSRGVESDVEAMIDAPRTGAHFSAERFEAFIDRGRLIVAPIVQPLRPCVRVEQVEGRDWHSLLDSRTIAVDASKVAFPLEVRPWQSGDRFCPFGMNKARLVSDFLKDSKLSLFEKRFVHLLVDAEGRVVWVIGLRADNRFRVGEGCSAVLLLRAGIDAEA